MLCTKLLPFSASSMWVWLLIDSSGRHARGVRSRYMRIIAFMRFIATWSWAMVTTL